MTTAETNRAMQAFADVLNGPISGGALLLRDARRRYLMDEIDVEEFEALVEKILSPPLAPPTPG